MSVEPIKTAVGIPVYNRFDMLKECVEAFVLDDRIDEVVIVDDASEEVYREKIREWIRKLPKVKCYWNPKNLDCYKNKHQAVWCCRSPRVILFDSDNIMTKQYLDAVFSVEWDSTTIYCPTFAKPHFDYRKFSGVTVDRRTVYAYADDPTFMTALNTANYLVPRAAYIDCFDPNVDPHTADSMWMAYRFLGMGYKLHFVPGMHYEHRVHDGSHYKLNVHKTGNFAAEIERRIKALR